MRAYTHGGWAHRQWVITAFLTRKNSVFSCARDGVRTSGHWILSPTFYQSSQPVTSWLHGQGGNTGVSLSFDIRLAGSLVFHSGQHWNFFLRLYNGLHSGNALWCLDFLLIRAHTNGFSLWLIIPPSHLLADITGSGRDISYLYLISFGVFKKFFLYLNLVTCEQLSMDMCPSSFFSGLNLLTNECWHFPAAFD